MKKIVNILIMSIVSSSILYGAELTMWLAPNAQQEAYWKIVTDEWNASGQGMKVVIKGIPVANSTEEAILNSVAAGTTADFSENINPSFAIQLADLDQLVDITKMPGYDELVNSRKMETIVSGWEEDGKNYVFPLYVNPILMWWNTELLKSAGVSEVPTTYEEVLELGAKAKLAKGNYIMLAYKGTEWWNRWFDFIGFYYAASNGKPYYDMEKNQVTYNDQYGKAATTFMSEMVKKGYAPLQVQNDEYFMGKVFADAKGPWDIPYGEKTFPNVMKNTVLAPLPVPAKDKTELQPTFADTKGIVIFKSSKHQKEAWEFIQWVMSKEEYSKLWLEKTGMSPARGDLIELESLKEYYSNSPHAATYASYVPVAIPTALTTKQTEILEIMTTSLLEPILYGKQTVDGGLKEAVTKTNRVLKED